MGKRWALGSNRDSSFARTVTRTPEVRAIAAPLLIVATSLDEAASVEHLFGSAVEATLVGVFARSSPDEPVVDLREPRANLETVKRVPAVSLDREPGDRQHTDDIAGLIHDAIESIDAATVAIGLGLLGGDHLEASDAALLARRRAKQRIRWMVYAVGERDVDAGRIARRRMALFVRGVRLEPVAIAEAPLGSSARFWEIRAPHRY